MAENIPDSGKKGPEKPGESGIEVKMEIRVSGDFKLTQQEMEARLKNFFKNQGTEVQDITIRTVSGKAGPEKVDPDPSVKAFPKEYWEMAPLDYTDKNTQALIEKLVEAYPDADKSRDLAKRAGLLTDRAYYLKSAPSIRWGTLLELATGQVKLRAIVEAAANDVNIDPKMRATLKAYLG